MKPKIISTLFFILITFILWTACEKIDQPLKIVDQKDFPVNPDDTLYFVDSIIVDLKQVLLEDFTGQRCVNCPKASKLLHEISDFYYPRLVSYTVHAGIFAEPVPGTVFGTDLRCPLSEKLYFDFGIFATPMGQIDRVLFNGLRQIFTTNWQSVVDQQMQIPNVVNLKLKNTYYPKHNSVIVDVEADFISDLEGQYNLVVYIVEDGIVTAHLNNDPTIGPDTLYNFIHHNVLRGPINSAYGDPINSSGNITAGLKFAKQYTFPINPNWVAENCNIIAYIGKKDPVLNLVDIIQAAELKIKTEQ
ncbi:MAG: Omp28-related outer membrane protein [Bacteroidales bacterium]|jgi:hypothetical protein|nr:Omp28-related outer membrane protein [Bacteroidales bacterium]MBP7873802.1 Omp28-related outer membrane protein [Bacteroidales bacterium]NLH32865.1 Omp28-related outer membrane protein [Lentimicrobium sp.]HOG66494.1 Omp28-related outer membrane protein [Bacteroidales bacterium]HQH15034.1 Omp28-related outer membrane protein [Bacteroidales bacterium]